MPVVISLRRRTPGFVLPQPLSRAPAERGVGRPPNPRRPALVRDVDAGVFGDLFAIFPDLPRPPRPAVRRVPLRGAGGSHP